MSVTSFKCLKQAVYGLSMWLSMWPTSPILLAEVGEPPYVAEPHAEAQYGEEELGGAVPGDPGLPLVPVHAATRGTPGPGPGGDVTTAGYRLACGRSIALLCSL